MYLGECFGHHHFELDLCCVHINKQRATNLQNTIFILLHYLYNYFHNRKLVIILIFFSIYFKLILFRIVDKMDQTEYPFQPWSTIEIMYRTLCLHYFQRLQLLSLGLDVSIRKLTIKLHLSNLFANSIV